MLADQLLGIMKLESTMTPDRGHAASAEDRTWVSSTPGDQRESAAYKDVPVALPMRDGSPGGSYGTATKDRRLALRRGR